MHTLWLRCRPHRSGCSIWHRLFVFAVFARDDHLYSPTCQGYYLSALQIFQLILCVCTEIEFESICRILFFFLYSNGPSPSISSTRSTDLWLWKMTKDWVLHFADHYHFSVYEYLLGVNKRRTRHDRLAVNAKIGRFICVNEIGIS